MIYDRLCCWPLRIGCILIGAISTVWWIIVAIIAVLYSALSNEQTAKENYLELFEDLTAQEREIFFYKVNPYSFYLTAKLAFCMAALMIVAGISIHIAGVWRIAYLVLLYPTLAALCGLVQTICLIIFYNNAPLPIFWYIGEAYISFCAIALFRLLKNPQTSLRRSGEGHDENIVVDDSVQRDAKLQRSLDKSNETEEDTEEETKAKHGRRHSKRHHRHRRRSHEHRDERIHQKQDENANHDNVKKGSGQA